jgi:hypothetical protein
MKKPKEPGFYWLYYKKQDEWIIGEFTGTEWYFLGSDVCLPDLTKDYHVGVEIIQPTYKPLK